MTKRGEMWSSLGLVGLTAICGWELVAAVLDGRHMPTETVSYVMKGAAGQAAFNSGPLSVGGHPTWLFVATFASRLPLLLLVGTALAAWLHHRCGTRSLHVRVIVAVLAVCSVALVVIGVGALLDGNMAAAVATLGGYPDSLRARAGEEVLFGLAALVVADLTSRTMRRTPASELAAQTAPTP